MKREAESIFLQSANFLQKYKIEQIQTVKTNLPYSSSCSIFKSNLIIPLKESLKNIYSCCVIFLTYIFLNLCPFHSWRSAIFLRSVTTKSKYIKRVHSVKIQYLRTSHGFAKLTSWHAIKTTLNITKKKLNMRSQYRRCVFHIKLWENAVSNAKSGIYKKTTLLIF